MAQATAQMPGAEWQDNLSNMEVYCAAAKRVATAVRRRTPKCFFFLIGWPQWLVEFSTDMFFSWPVKLRLDSFFFNIIFWIKNNLAELDGIDRERRRNQLAFELMKCVFFATMLLPVASLPFDSWTCHLRSLFSRAWSSTNRDFSWIFHCTAFLVSRG